MDGKTTRRRFLRLLATSGGALVAGGALSVPAAAASSQDHPAHMQGTNAFTWETVELGPGDHMRLTSGIGDYILQVGRGDEPHRRILQITLRIGPDVQHMATWGATVSGAVKINGKNTSWTYNKAAQALDYNFHSSLNKYQNEGDAPWTSHRLRSGDLVEIAYTALIPNVDRSTSVANYRTSVRVW